MGKKREHGQFMLPCSAEEKHGSEITRQCAQLEKRMLRIAQACARLAARSISTHEAVEIALEAKRQLECEIMLAQERMRHALANRMAQKR